MASIFMLVVLVTVLGCIKSSSIAHTVYARDGSSVTLYCYGGIEQSVWWTSRTVTHSERDRRPIYRNRLMVDSYKASGRFSAWSLNNGTYALRITNVNVFDSGEYQCVPNEGNDNPITTRLVVTLDRTTLSSTTHYISYEHRVGALHGSEMFTFNSTHRTSAWIHYSDADTVKPVLIGKNQILTAGIDAITYTLSIPNVLRSSTGYYFGVAHTHPMVTMLGHAYRLSIDRITYYPGILEYIYSRLRIPAYSRKEIRLKSTQYAHIDCCSDDQNNVTWYLTKWYADHSVPIGWNDILVTSGLITSHSIDRYKIVDGCLHSVRFNALLDAGIYGCVTSTYRREYDVAIRDTSSTYNELYEYKIAESVIISCNLTDPMGWMYDMVPIWSTRNGLLDRKHLSFNDTISASEIVIPSVSARHAGIYTCANIIGHHVDIKIVIIPDDIKSSAVRVNRLSVQILAIHLLCTVLKHI